MTGYKALVTDPKSSINDPVDFVQMFKKGLAYEKEKCQLTGVHHVRQVYNVKYNLIQKMGVRSYKEVNP